MKASHNDNGIEKKQFFAKSRKSITIFTVVVVLAVMIFNIVITMIADANLWYIDMTSVRYKSGDAAMYTLSDSCADLIGSDAIPMIEEINREREQRGEEPIKLNIIFCSDRDIIENGAKTGYINMTARALEKKYPHAIDVQYINIKKNPSAVQKFKTTSASTIYSSDVIVEFGTEYLIQRESAFYYQDDGKSTPWAYIGEQRLSAMILSLTRAESPICAITTNHGESLFDTDGNVKKEYSSFIKLLGGAGYEVMFIDLEKDDIPDKCRMMITFDPQTDFKAFGSLGENGVSEIDKLDRYLEDSNAFFYICSRETPELKNLEEYLKEWGVTMSREHNAAGLYENYVVKDSINCTDIGKGDIIVGKYGEEGISDAITSELKKQAYPPMVIFGNSTTIEPSDSYIKTFVEEDKENGIEECSYYSYFRNGVSRRLVDVFTTYDTASAYIDGKVHEISTDLNPFRLMTLTKESRAIQETNYTTIDSSSYVLALSSTDFLTNSVLDSSAYGNTDVLLSALRSVGREAVPANIKLKVFYVYDMDNITDEQKYITERNTWFICLTVIPTAIAVVVGTVIVIKRKVR